MSEGTLIIAIQAIAAKIRTLRIAVMSGEAEPEEHQLLEERIEAAEDLERGR